MADSGRRADRVSARTASAPEGAAPDVDALIREAASHPLGIGYLRDGWLDSVAATFGVHAFLVDEARERLRTRGPDLPRPLGRHA